MRRSKLLKRSYGLEARAWKGDWVKETLGRVPGERGKSGSKNSRKMCLKRGARERGGFEKLIKLTKWCTDWNIEARAVPTQGVTLGVRGRKNTVKCRVNLESPKNDKITT